MGAPVAADPIRFADGTADDDDDDDVVYSRDPFTRGMLYETGPSSTGSSGSADGDAAGESGQDLDISSVSSSCAAGKQREVSP